MRLSVFKLQSISGKMINVVGAGGEMAVGSGNQGAQKKRIPMSFCPPKTKNPT
jgi:hypothetical protein